MLKLYGQYRSRAFRVAWLCAESNIAYEHVQVTIHSDDATAKAAWYRELNPNARIPTIDDDGFIMWESAAINLYLAEKYHSPLWPADWAGKGRALQWAFYISNDVEVPMIAVFQHRFRFPPEKRTPAIADQHEPTLLTKLGVLDAALGRAKFFQGERWGMADFMIASVLYSLHEMQYAKLADYPRLKGWLTESVARPGAQKAIALRTAS
jgi:glutathione S-transferase